MDKKQHRVYHYDDIEQVVAKHIETYGDEGQKIAQCPFHKGKTKTLFLDAFSNRFLCTECGKHGDTFDFVDLMENKEAWDLS